MLIIVIYMRRPSPMNVNSLIGFWEADDVFKEQSGLLDFYMYIGAKKNGIHPSYVLMIDENENIIISKPIQCDIKQCGKTLIWSSNDTDDVIPQKLNLELDVNTGIIEMFDKDTLYAKFVRNNKLSNICKPEVRSAVDNIINDNDEPDDESEDESDEDN